MMLLPKDIAADAVESSSAAALAIAAADRIPCGRDAVAAADAAESSDEYPPREPPSFAARTPPCDSVVTIDPTALSPASATTPSLMAAAADVIINPTALLSASAAPPSLLLSFMHRRANFCTCFHHDSAGRCCLCCPADAASDATTAADRFPCWHDAVAAADTADAAESSAESSVASINQPPSFAVRTPTRAAAADVTIDPTALSPASGLVACCCLLLLLTTLLLSRHHDSVLMKA
jgi:hypothetical protein